MNSYDKAVALNLTGTEAENVAVLQALTVADIPIKAVQRWFREHDLWMQGPGGKMLGQLAAVYQSNQTPAEAIAGLDYLWATVFGNSAVSLETTNPEWAVKVRQLVGLVVSLVPSATGLVDSFYALDGGRPFKSLTVEQYAADKTASVNAAAAAQALQTAMDLRAGWQVRFDAAMNTIGTSEQAAGVADLRAIADEIEAG